ncbi:MAG TPA: SMC-Scp complex subunit ScpB [Candidatus Paceibacterota bacterium]|nr:SMC-Scp complex subunit ScpB [Candidatus Paceibacterota bacterium]
MNEQQLALQIEALLFALGRPVARKELASKLGVEMPELELGLRELMRATAGRGIVCVDDGTEVELRAGPQAAEMIERVRKEELSREVGRAGLEALSAILYRGPLTRSEIDFIRGVNSSQTLRTLMMRGLVRKVPNPKDQRQWLYEPTTELMAELGVREREDLPDYDAVREKLTQLEAAYRMKEQEPATHDDPAAQ